jgi:hypothetical protein
MRTLLFAFLAVALLTGSVEADDIPFSPFISGNDLWTWCSSREVRSVNLCLGYALGAADVWTVVSTRPQWDLAKVCLPSAVKPDQVRDVVIRYLREHPEDRHNPAALAAYSALKDAFPCAAPN